MTVLEQFFASKPVGEMLIRTLEFKVDGEEPIRVCQGFKDRYLLVDGVARKFECCSLSINLPAENSTGTQTLTFGIQGSSKRVGQGIKKALESNSVATLIYREYLLTDITQPASAPLVMNLIGGALQGQEAVFEGGYFDILNSAWPRDRYTSETAPGVQYL